MGFDGLWVDRSLALSEPQDFTINTVRPPESLAPYINSFYTFRSESNLIRDVQPASFGHVMFFLNGAGEARFIDGTIFESHPISLIGPSTSAMQYLVKGPFHCIGLAFHPAGYFSFTGQNAKDSSNQLIDGKRALEDLQLQLLGKLKELNAGSPSEENDQKMFGLLAQHLEGRFKPVRQKHDDAITKMFEWLNSSLSPELSELYDIVEISPRQMQRICNDHIGCSPKYLIRKYRAIRASMILNDPDCDNAKRDQLSDYFYDQPHMIRELNLFTGRTPKIIDQEATPLLQMWLDRAKAAEKSGIYPQISPKEDDHPQ